LLQLIHIPIIYYIQDAHNSPNIPQCSAFLLIEAAHKTLKELILLTANVESMFYVREAPWHGLGKKVEHALCSKEALTEAGLDWRVIQRQLLTDNLLDVPGFKANIRETDQQLLGIVTDRYSIV
jgi:hypothetical protein